MSFSILLLSICYALNLNCLLQTVYIVGPFFSKTMLPIISTFWLKCLFHLHLIVITYEVGFTSAILLFVFGMFYVLFDLLFLCYCLLFSQIFSNISFLFPCYFYHIFSYFLNGFPGITVNIFLKTFIYFMYFIFGCIGSLLLRVGFSQLQRVGATLRCGSRASHCSGFSCCVAWAIGAQTSVVAARGLSSYGSRALECRLSSCVHGLSCSAACGIFLDRARTCVPCIGRQIFNHCTTREALQLTP